MNNQIFRIWFNNTYILTPYMTIDMNGRVWFDEWASTDGTYGYPNEHIDITDKCCIERSTGIPDKSGKLIYDGDLIKSPNNSYPLRVYQDKSGTWRTVEHRKNGAEELCLLTLANAYGIEITGNTHDQKEYQ